MAATPVVTLTPSTIVTIIIFFSSAFVLANSEQFARELHRNKLDQKREKLTHLHFYFHDILSGANPTAVDVAQAATTNASATGFGLVRVMDEPLTESQNLSSKQVGRAQGIYTSADSRTVGLLMVLNFEFTEGKYNGSTLSLLGRNAVLSGVREMPIVGGSGLFRYATGYAQAKTREFDPATGNAIVEYNVFARHY
ncbi:hypothetical protein BUALT_Bualt12G0003800 [Buddleja alternifolia]|uniref:Dirigent protein n=1 Tax=Buddleja alternifolia TaxID=168488 RepID=A0AAV6WP10_9LAMI|nr:hypothetical protein BUALT_Bualt12G0003800 [Buddleja alternifolia]